MGRKFITGGKIRFWWLLGALVLAVTLEPGLAAAVLTVDTSLGNSPYTMTGNLNNGFLFVGTTAGGGVFNQDNFTNAVTDDLFLGFNSGSSGTYNLSNTGSLSAASEVIGWNGSGAFTQSGGTNRLSDYLYLGFNSGSSGTYDLSNTGSLSADAELIGINGSGAFTQSGGTNTINDSLYLGLFTGGSDTYELSGTGSLSATKEYIGINGSGAFNQSGGTNTLANNLLLGVNSGGSNGTYDLSGTGSLSAFAEEIGVSGSGTFTQKGGTNAVAGTLTLAENAGSTGTYNLQDGSLTAGTINLNAGGLFNQTGGTLNFTTFNQSGGTGIFTDLYLGRNVGDSSTYNLSGGSVTANDEFVGYRGSGDFIQSGGTNRVNTNLYLGIYSGGSGTYNLSGGSLSAWSESIGLQGIGTFTQSGGTNTLTGTGDQFKLGAISGGSGTYNLSGTGSLSTIREFIGYDGSGTFTQKGGTNSVSDTLYLGDSSGSSGTYNLSGGSLVGADEEIGCSGSGTFLQSGGTNTMKAAGVLSLGENSGGTGTYNLSGGSLTAWREIIGLSGSGVFNQTDGTNTVNSDLDVGPPGSSGTYNFFGGSLAAGSVDVESNGVFRGFGTVDSGTFTNSGLVAPGDAPGTLTINGGPYTQTASGTLAVDIASATSYSKLAVTGTPGTATLSGTVQPILLNGYIPRANQVFPGVVTTAHGLSGTFSTLANAQITPILSWEPFYTANDFSLKAVANFMAPSLGLNANELQVAAMLNSVVNTATGDLTTVLSAIDSLTTTSAVRNAYNQISPEKFGALSNLCFEVAYSQFQNLSRRITNLRYGYGGAGTGWGPGAFNLSCSRLAGMMLAYNSSNISRLITAKQVAAPESRYGLYLQPDLILGSQDTTTNQTGYDFTAAGFTLGGDLRLRPDLIVGLASGYSHTGAAFRGSGGGLENNTWPLTAYVAYLPKSFYAFGSLGYSLNLFSMERHLNFGGLDRTASSSPTGNQLNVYGESGYDLHLKPLVVTPDVSLAYSHLWLGSFTESGAGALDLHVDSQSADSLQSGLGAKVALPLKRGATLVVPQVYASWQHEFSNDSRGLDATLSQGSSTFAWQTAEPARDFAQVGADVTLSEKNLTVQLDYNTELGRDNFTAHNISAGLRYAF